jgi:hypothetical protein
MEHRSPPERFPQIGTVEDPAYFRDCEGRLLLCYEIAPADGGGNVILEFSNVVYFEQNPNNVAEGLRNSQYPARAWDFAEVTDSDRNAKWSTAYFPRRFWTISFNDWMLEVVFSGVRQVLVTRAPITPDIALMDYLRTPR